MSDYTPRGEGEGASGWVRVGRYDSAERRAMWARIAATPEDAETGEYQVLSVELCAGREGDDAYVKVLPDNPIFVDLLDVVGRSIDAVHGSIHFHGFVNPTLTATPEPSADSGNASKGDG